MRTTNLENAVWLDILAEMQSPKDVCVNFFTKFCRNQIMNTFTKLPSKVWDHRSSWTFRAYVGGWLPTFRYNLSVQVERVLLDCLAYEDGNDKLSRNSGDSAEHPWRFKISFTPRQMPEVTPVKHSFHCAKFYDRHNDLTSFYLVSHFIQIG